MTATVFMTAPTERGQVIRMVGRGTAAESQVIRRLVGEYLSHGLPVVVDLSQCDYADSAFMGGLIWLHKFAGERNPENLSFFGSEKKIRELFGVCLLDRVLNITHERPNPTEEFEVVRIDSNRNAGIASFVSDCDKRLSDLVDLEAKRFPNRPEIPKKPKTDRTPRSG